MKSRNRAFHGDTVVIQAIDRTTAKIVHILQRGNRPTQLQGNLRHDTDGSCIFIPTLKRDPFVTVDPNHIPANFPDPFSPRAVCTLDGNRLEWSESDKYPVGHLVNVQIAPANNFEKEKPERTSKVPPLSLSFPFNSSSPNHSHCHRGMISTGDSSLCPSRGPVSAAGSSRRE